jgi:hypothetical protein
MQSTPAQVEENQYSPEEASILARFSRRARPDVPNTDNFEATFVIL